MAGTASQSRGREGLATVIAVSFVALTSAVLLTALSLLLARLGDLCADHPFVIGLLPLAGVATYGLYRFLEVPFDLTDATVIYRVSTDHDELSKKPVVPSRLIIAILMGTTLTIAFGGSVGGESAAFQVGSALALCGVIRWLFDHIAPGHKNFIDTTLLARCGMTSALAALFAAPLTATLFIAEMSYWLTYKHDWKTRAKTLSLMLGSAFLGMFVCQFAKGEALGWHVRSLEVSTLCVSDVGAVILRCISLFLLMLGAALTWYYVLDIGRKAGSKFVTQASGSLRHVVLILGVGAVSALLIFTLRSLVGYGEIGTGSVLMQTTLSGNLITDDVHTLAIGAAKLVLTALLLSGLFKGGDLTPTMAIGATLGAGSAALLGLPVAFGALVGLSVFLPVCTNCVLAALAFGLETFGLPGLVLSFPFALVAFALTKGMSFYHNTLHADPR